MKSVDSFDVDPTTIPVDLAPARKQNVDAYRALYLAIRELEKGDEERAAMSLWSAIEALDVEVDRDG